MSAVCPKRNGEMIPGNLDPSGRAYTRFKAKSQGFFSFRTHLQKVLACVECGYLEFYLDPEELSRNTGRGD